MGEARLLPEDAEKEEGSEDQLPLLRRWHLNVSRGYYSAAHALGLGKLQDYFKASLNA